MSDEAAGAWRRADESPAEEVAVPDEDIVAELVEGIGAAAAAVMPHDEAPPRPPRPRVTLRAEPRERPHVVLPPLTEETGAVPRGTEVPGPPSGEPREPPPPDAGYPLGTDMPFGIGEDSPMNEGSEDTAVPPVDPAEQRLDG